MVDLGRSDDLAKVLSDLGRRSKTTWGEKIREPTLLIVDSNFIIKAVCSRAKSKDPSTCRTAFEEAADSCVISAFAPVHLVKEVDDNLAEWVYKDLARKHGVEAATIDYCWSRIGSCIGYLSPPPLESASIDFIRSKDETDVPFAQLFEYLKPRAILTDDSIFSRAGYPVIEKEASESFVLLIRDYARHASTALGFNKFTANMTIFAVIVIAVLGTASEHPKVALAALSVLAGMKDSEGQSGLLSVVEDTRDFFEEVLWPNIEEAFDYAGKSRALLERVNEELQPILDGLPPAPRLTLDRAVLMACMLAQQPVHEKLIQMITYALGYKPRSNDNIKYLRSVLGERQELIKVDKRIWSVDPRFTVPCDRFSDTMTD